MCSQDSVSSRCALTSRDYDLTGTTYSCAEAGEGESALAAWFVMDSEQSLIKAPGGFPILPSTSALSPCSGSWPVSASPLCACTDCACNAPPCSD
jgi:hypothetical protein